MNVSDTLNLAADHIEAFGHSKGEGFGGGDVHTAPACIYGALILSAPDNDLKDAAAKAIRTHIGGFIVGWNDAPERTATEVVEVLRATALIAAARERETAAVTR